MTPIKKYKKYRKIGTELNHKIMRTCLERDVLWNSAKLLGIAQGDILFFDSEDETSVLMDFALNDYRVDNKNTVETYREKMGWQNEIEKEILDAMLSSYTSLFKITSISEAENSLLLNDLINKKDGIELTDIGMSKTGIPRLLIFTRLVPFEDLSMTSGVSFAFPAGMEKYLLRRYKKLGKKVKSDSDSVKRFVSFFKLNKRHGIETRYE